jgi:TM2 domain-containing membrane protein YozV
MKKGLVVLLIAAGLFTVMGASAGAQTHDAWIPGIASFLIPGLGQLLNDQVDKAIVHFGLGLGIPVVGALAVSILPWEVRAPGYSAVALATIIYRVYSGLDAYNVAKKTGFSLGLAQDGITLSYRF